eukprot:CAMPEP_0181336922 /NCGR_PEP_ID=MMETSP1101-20121128/27709_1 /TAXON_ID=46948 /ORGANISM="Rhodomonas abbreviata, Strain Caron Lab Isolate" /LENGTH=83 /DNA_ID=CAMNT_0023447313 /DNA_START=15 /DNA_END=262 /DNA_ORIENTATION=+
MITREFQRWSSSDDHGGAPADHEGATAMILHLWRGRLPASLVVTSSGGKLVVTTTLNPARAIAEPASLSSSLKNFSITSLFAT